MLLNFKRDNFKTSRGGYSRFIKLYCRLCKCFVALYQKDGAGSLRRLYLDRIFVPRALAELMGKSLAKIPVLKCKKCGELLGTPYIYKKENRKAFKLYQDALYKK